MLTQLIKPSYYPLNPVVAHDPLLRTHYNENFESACLLSECLTANELGTLWLQKPKLKIIILVNDDGKELIQNIGCGDHWDEEVHPVIKMIHFDGCYLDQWILQLHALIRDSVSGCG